MFFDDGKKIGVVVYWKEQYGIGYEIGFEIDMQCK